MIAMGFRALSIRSKQGVTRLDEEEAGKGERRVARGFTRDQEWEKSLQECGKQKNEGR